MKHQKIALLALLAIACNRVDESLDSLGGYVASSDHISFNESITTKGDILDDNEYYKFDDMEIYAYYTAQEAWTSEDVAPENFMHQQLAARNYDATSTSWSDWSYSPLKYWPNNDGDMVTFYGFAPYGDIVHSTDEGTAKPKFTYTLSPLANENDDLLAAVSYNNKKSAGGGVALDFKHALTRLTLKAKVNELPTQVNQLIAGETNVRYSVNGITFYGIESMGELLLDEQGDVSWKMIESTSSLINYTATQGQTLIPYEDTESDLTTSPEDISIDGKAIFVLPHTLSTDARLQVRVRKEYDLVVWIPEAEWDISTSNSYDGGDKILVPIEGDENNFDTYYVPYTEDADGNKEYVIKTDGENKELIYETEEYEIPIPTEAGGAWRVGDWINMIFTFYVDNSHNMPMTVASTIHDWTETNVDVDIHHNTYIYSSSNNLEIQTDTDDSKYGEFMICTNYYYNLRTPHHRTELDGAITSSRGFLFYSDDYNGVSTDGYDSGTVTIDGTEYKTFVPTLMSGTYELKYATETNITTTDNIIYEYPDGYNTPDTRRALLNGATKSDIVYGTSNKYAFILDGDKYRLLYLDPKQSGALTAFNYETNAEGYHEIKLTNFADNEGTVDFRVIIGDADGADATYSDDNPYHFDFKVRRSTRDEMGLYTSTAVDTDASYGVNKLGTDAVYILRLNVDTSHLTEANNFSFNDVIGVEMISNGGGLITSRFAVSLTQ